MTFIRPQKKRGCLKFPQESQTASFYFDKLLFWDLLLNAYSMCPPFVQNIIGKLYANMCFKAFFIENK
jgi:hypothetical protein